MIWIGFLLGSVGLLLSAFFSGSETGFYRVAPIRLQLDALGGDRLARWLFWLTNHPSIFVATCLIGNNLANYMVSLSIVLLVHAVLPRESMLAGELIAPLLLTPVLFVYGELMPKYLFLHAPHSLLRRGGPIFFLFVPLFFPISAVLYLFNRVVARSLGQPHDVIRPSLARRELERVLNEGHEAGVLRSSQWRLAKGLFAVTKESIRRYTTPLAKYPRARVDMPKADVLRMAKRFGVAELPVVAQRRPRDLVGYVRVIDLRTSQDDAVRLRPLLEISREESPVRALLMMQERGEALAAVLGKEGAPVGIVTATRLRELLFHGGESRT